jgi:hypothetical protein
LVAKGSRHFIMDILCIQHGKGLQPVGADVNKTKEKIIMNNQESPEATFLFVGNIKA